MESNSELVTMTMMSFLIVFELLVVIVLLESIRSKLDEKQGTKE